MSSPATALSADKPILDTTAYGAKTGNVTPQSLKTSATTVVNDNQNLISEESKTKEKNSEEADQMEVERVESQEVEIKEEKIYQIQNASDSKQESSEMNFTEARDKEKEISQAEKVQSKVCVENATTQTESAIKYKMVPIVKQSDTHQPSKVAVPRRNPPLSMPIMNERPLVLATHLVPSLPISLFEVFVEAIEVVTKKPVVLLYEPRSDRPVAKDVTDIAILPANEEWEAGELLPASFCFEHPLNKDNSPCVYADVVVAGDRAVHVEDITDLRGHRCSVPDRRKRIGAAALLFNHLHTRGESPSFFGNTLDANTQVATLQMVAGKQAEVGILEAPVIKCHKNSLPGVESVHILASLGPLPPYRIMVNKTLPDDLVRKITTFLLHIDQDKEWVERFSPFGVTGFAQNSPELYHLSDMKSVVTSVPYY